MVAALLTYQPFYIGGIDNVSSATRNAYGAMATFLFTLILSVVYLVMDVLKGGGSSSSSYNDRGMPSSNMDYDMVPSSNAIMAGGSADRILQQHNANLDLPMSVEQAHFT